jgi:pimeloyl-ACP methyl ester carboxylesterase
MSPADYWFQSDEGLRLFARLYESAVPAAPVVVCLHGLTRNGSDFEELALHLARRFRVVVPDVRGRGHSARDPNPANYRLAVYLRDLEILCGGLGIERAAIVGTSMGGLMAITLGATQPEQITRIVLNDIGPELAPEGMQRIRGYAGRSPKVSQWSDAVAQVRLVNTVAWPDLTEARWEQITRRTYHANPDGTYEPYADPMIGEALRAAGPSRDLWPLWRALGELPVLVLRGELSDLLTQEILERMAREKPDLQSVTIPNRGHAPLLDEPASVARIDAFLAAT